VGGYIEQDNTINRKLEKSGEYPYRITYDAKDPLGNTAGGSLSTTSRPTYNRQLPGFRT